MRAGEIVALEWADVDIERRQIRVRHSDWCGELIAPKNRRIRFIAMTDAPSGTSTVRWASVPDFPSNLRPRRALGNRVEYLGLLALGRVTVGVDN